jgi:signal transduction histidine kinase
MFVGQGEDPVARRRSTTLKPQSSLVAAGEVARVRRRFERLLEAGVAIFSEHSLNAVLQRVADSARDVVGARYAALGVLDEAGSGLARFVVSGMSDAERARIGDLPTGRGLLGLVIRKRTPIRSADLNRHPERFGFPPHHPPMKSFLGVPIVLRGRVFGNLYLTEKIGADEFDAEDEGIAVFLAMKAAVAVESARLYEQSQQLLREVQAMHRQRDLFFATMNHELRNALTGVYGWSQRLVQVKNSPERLAEAALEVYEGAERTITLLNNFLDLSRIDAGKMRPVMRDVDVHAAVKRVFASARPAAEAKQIVLEEHCGSGTSHLRTDPVRLEQILLNLLNNAVRYSPDGTTVTLHVAHEGDGVCFHVTDQGPGIPAEVQEWIFEPFERFDPESGVGAGLGLPVSRRLADLLGGRLTVQSRVGEGAKFTLTLPAASPGV